jgi:hypothetical protein
MPPSFGTRAQLRPDPKGLGIEQIRRDLFAEAGVGQNRLQSRWLDEEGSAAEVKQANESGPGF